MYRVKRGMLVAAVVAFGSGCIVVSDGGERVSRSAELEAFDSLLVDRSFDFVEVEVCGDCQPDIVVQGSEAEVDDVRMVVVGGTLELEGARSPGWSRADLTARVRARSLDLVTSTSSADIEVRDIDTDVFELISSGSGDTTLAGRVGVLDVTSSGSGDLHAFELRADTVDATMSGSGDAEVCATGLLRGRLTGSGDLVYDCAPAQRDVSSAGSGDISIR